MGQAVAAQLSISSGTLDSQGLQELGILNQVRPSKAESLLLIVLETLRLSMLSTVLLSLNMCRALRMRLAALQASWARGLLDFQASWRTARTSVAYPLIYRSRGF